jgi:methionyl-tRNA formyltransferase
MGTPDFSVPVLSEILESGHEIAAVYTRAPKPAGRRGLELTLSPIHAMAERLNIPVKTPASLRPPEALAELQALSPDLIVVVAYGLILPKTILECPPMGCLNLHASLLPRWRGAAPIQRAIMAGDTQTGVMVMRMEEGLDTGPVAASKIVNIEADLTAEQLHDRLSLAGAKLMASTLQELAKGNVEFVPQSEEGVTYAKKIEKSEARIDWSQPAGELHNHIRGLSPHPGAYFEVDFGKGLERIKALRSSPADGAGAPGLVLDDNLTIACGSGALRLLEIQRSGKGPMPAQDFLRGAKIVSGTWLATL